MPVRLPGLELLSLRVNGVLSEPVGGLADESMFDFRPARGLPLHPRATPVPKCQDSMFLMLLTQELTGCRHRIARGWQDAVIAREIVE